MSQSKSILIVEDDPSALELLEFSFSAKGYQVLSAESPEAAWDLMTQNSNIDMGFIDVNFENSPMNGYQLGEKIRDEAPTKFPFLIMCMDDTPENHEKAKSCGAIGLINKDADDLFESLLARL